MQYYLSLIAILGLYSLSRAYLYTHSIKLTKSLHLQNKSSLKLVENDKNTEYLKIIKWIKNSNAIIVIPTQYLNLDDINNLRKMLPITNDSEYKTSVETKSKLLEYIDASPFSLITSNDLTSSNFCIFVNDTIDKVREFLQGWVKQYSKTNVQSKKFQIILCTKLYCAKIDIQ